MSFPARCHGTLQELIGVFPELLDRFIGQLRRSTESEDKNKDGDSSYRSAEQEYYQTHLVHHRVLKTFERPGQGNAKSGECPHYQRYQKYSRQSRANPYRNE